MKTPMQELIQSLKAEQMIASNEWQMGYQKALSNVIFEIESMLEKEKEVMGEFADEFSRECINYHHEKIMSTDKFFELTFNAKEK